MPHERGRIHSKWPQLIGDTSLGRASDGLYLPADAGARAMEEYVAQACHFKMTYSQHIGGHAGSDS